MNMSTISCMFLGKALWSEGLKVSCSFRVNVTQYVSLQLCRQSVVNVVNA